MPVLSRGVKLRHVSLDCRTRPAHSTSHSFSISPHISRANGDIIVQILTKSTKLRYLTAVITNRAARSARLVYNRVHHSLCIMILRR
jgi:hypothetical protein